MTSYLESRLILGGFNFLQAPGVTAYQLGGPLGVGRQVTAQSSVDEISSRGARDAAPNGGGQLVDARSEMVG